MNRADPLELERLSVLRDIAVWWFGPNLGLVAHELARVRYNQMWARGAVGVSPTSQPEAGELHG